ncbi:TetR family transcriptional regulator [Gryllotalpicola reticulitermitis]|uniref:TetR family transcriptional regulator n=1 Tax=Gryllotalpicola reticulitermitis TaxID=1184153 RepID=A0ABV8Q6J5_9MICO
MPVPETTGPSRRAPRRGRGQSAGLDRTRIAAAAHGLSPRELTMQAVAQRLGVDRSALHYHVPDRAALLELVAEHTFATYLSPTRIAPGTDWREGCLVLARATRDSVLATGQFASFLRLSSPAGADTLGPAEAVLGKMRAAGFDLESAAKALYALSGLAIALAQGQLAAATGEHPQIPETRRALAASTTHRHPLLEKVFESSDTHFFDDEGFDASIRIFTDGLAAQLAHGGSRTIPVPAPTLRWPERLGESGGGAPGTRARGAYAAGRARREQIVQEASRLFAERGFEGVTTQAIADACGITRAGVLHHFPDKESILAAVLAVSLGGPEDERRAAPYLSAPDGIGPLHGIVELSDRERTSPGLTAMVIRLAVEATDPAHPAHDYFLGRYREIYGGMAEVFRLAARARYVREDTDPERAAVRLNALIDGLQLQWLLDNPVDVSSHVRDYVLELLTPAGVEAFLAAERSRELRDLSSS